MRIEKLQGGFWKVSLSVLFSSVLLPRNLSLSHAVIFRKETLAPAWHSWRQAFPNRPTDPKTHLWCY